MIGDGRDVDLGLGQERISRHDRLRNDRTWIRQMRDMPIVEYLAPTRAKIGPGAFRAH